MRILSNFLANNDEYLLNMKVIIFFDNFYEGKYFFDNEQNMESKIYLLMISPKYE